MNAFVVDWSICGEILGRGNLDWDHYNIFSTRTDIPVRCIVPSYMSAFPVWKKSVPFQSVYVVVQLMTNWTFIRFSKWRRLPCRARRDRKRNASHLFTSIDTTNASGRNEFFFMIGHDEYFNLTLWDGLGKRSDLRRRAPRTRRQDGFVSDAPQTTLDNSNSGCSYLRYLYCHPSEWIITYTDFIVLCFLGHSVEVKIGNVTFFFSLCNWCDSTAENVQCIYTFDAGWLWRD